MYTAMAIRADRGTIMSAADPKTCGTAALTLPGLLRLLHLASPGLPVGAFAYSQGLEPAVLAGWVHDETSAGAWIGGLLEHGLGGLEVPLFRRLYRAWSDRDDVEVARWNEVLHAARATSELQAEDRRLGAALARVLMTLGVSGAAGWADHPRVTQVNLFALACSAWEIPVQPAAAALLFTWCENQVAAAVRLVPLGQSAGLRILSRLAGIVPAVVLEGLARTDDQIGQGAPGLGLASAWHETQYSRIFRS
jgi:urease accessory protein